MQRLLAALLLFCVGILIPASATPVRVCLLEFGLSSVKQDFPCCEDCNQGTDRPDTCCYDLEKLPDSLTPGIAVELPAAVVTDVLVAWFPTLVMTFAASDRFPVSAPIRGPTSPAAHRAVLGIWRL